MFLIILLSIPMIINADIIINVNIEVNKINIDYSGNDYKVVTDKELNLFNITKERLNNGTRVELGRFPYDIYLKNPTPYGDLFGKYSWEEMKRRVNVQQSKVIDMIFEDVVLDTHEHINTTPNNITSKRSMYKVVESTISSTWSKHGVPNDDIFYSLNFNLGYGKFKYENKWRNESLRSVYLPIGVSKKGDITIKPGQTVVTKLTAAKTIMLIELVYEAKLVGSLVANYDHEYGKYHFYAPSVVSIMKAANMTNEVNTTEIVEVRCFTNPRLDVYDKYTGEVVEPPRKKLPKMKILRNHNKTRIIYVKTKKPKHKKKLKNKMNKKKL